MQNIVKTLLDPDFNPNHNKLSLATASGIKRVDSRDGGTKYVKMTAREDYLNKAEILSSGAIIFPTLSDKSTWFYLRGIQLPGFNWKDRSGRSFDVLPYFGVKSGKIFFDAKDKRGEFQPNEQLDQLIEYAYCDYRSALSVLHQIQNNEIPETEKVNNFHTGDMHGARLAFLLGIYDENGKYISFNNNKMTPEQCLQKAYEYFFQQKEDETEEQLRARQRYMMSTILQHRLDEELESLVKKGIIERVPYNSTYVIDGKNARQEWNKVQASLPHYFTYRNRYLDDAKIQYLVDQYAKMELGNGKKFGDRYSRVQLESLAIVAYVNDVNTKSIMSLQETQRIFTGMPHFFKWKYDKQGNLIDIRSDESKRYGGAGSTGTNNRSDLPNIETEYTCAEIKDYEIASPIEKSLAQSFRDNEYRDALVTLKIQEQKRLDTETYEPMTDEEVYETVYSMSLEDVIKEVIRIDEETGNTRNGKSITVDIVEAKYCIYNR